MNEEGANVKYSKCVRDGKKRENLSDFERRQAFVNEAIDEGQRKFGAINTVTPTTAEKFEHVMIGVIGNTVLLISLVQVF